VTVAARCPQLQTAAGSHAIALAHRISHMRPRAKASRLPPRPAAPPKLMAKAPRACAVARSPTAAAPQPHVASPAGRRRRVRLEQEPVVRQGLGNGWALGNWEKGRVREQPNRREGGRADRTQKEGRVGCGRALALRLSNAAKPKSGGRFARPLFGLKLGSACIGGAK